jgi:hypothetical protein
MNLFEEIILVNKQLKKVENNKLKKIEKLRKLCDEKFKELTEKYELEKIGLFLTLNDNSVLREISILNDQFCIKVILKVIDIKKFINSISTTIPKLNRLWTLDVLIDFYLSAKGEIISFSADTSAFTFISHVDIPIFKNYINFINDELYKATNENIYHFDYETKLPVIPDLFYVMEELLRNIKNYTIKLNLENIIDKF